MKELDVEKLKKEKAAKSKGEGVLGFPVYVDGIHDVEQAVKDLYELLNGKEEYDFDKLSKQLETISSKLDLDEQFRSLEKSLKATSIDTSELHSKAYKTNSEGFSRLIKAIEANKPLPVHIDLSKVEKAIIQVREQIEAQTVDPKQAPEEYTPVRRVVKVGNRLLFDDQPTPTRGGGGGSSTPSTTPVTQSTSPWVITSDSSSLYSGSTALTPKFAVIDNASSGDNTIVAAVSSKKIRVLSVVLISTGTVNVRFESGAGGTALTGVMNLVANTGFSTGYSPVGHFETAAGALLNLELSGAVSVDGFLTYIEV